MILVVGATGRVGGAIARQLLERGETVRALVRQGSDHGWLAERGAEVVFGDLKDGPSLDRACRGCEQVVTTANSARRTGADTVDAVDLEGTRRLIDAAAGAGARHFVYTSVLGADAASKVPFLAAKAQSEAHLEASGLSWTVLAPNVFMETWPLRIVGVPAAAGQTVTIIGSGHRKHAFVAERDVAAFALAGLTTPKAQNRRFQIGGPEALSWRDVVALYERLLGRPVEASFVAPGEAVLNIAPAVVPLLAALDTYDTTFDTTAVARELGITLTPLEDVARASLSAAS